MPSLTASEGDTKSVPSLKNTFATIAVVAVFSPGPTIPSLPELLAKVYPFDVLPTILSALALPDTNSLSGLLSL